MSKPPIQRKQPAKSQPMPAREPEIENGEPSSWLDHLEGWRVRLSRFGWDFLGVILVTFGLLTLLGLTGLTKGSFISPWGIVLRKWFGWGGFAIPILLVWLGWLCLRLRAGNPWRIPLGRILAMEGLYFSLLVLFSAFGGYSLERADSGLDGGIIGWGLAEFTSQGLPVPWGTILWLVMAILFAFIGFGLGRELLHLLNRWLEESTETDGAGAEKVLEPDPLPRPVTEPLVEELDQSLQRAERDPRLPPLKTLNHGQALQPDEDQIRSIGLQIRTTLGEFGIPVRVIGYRVGPTVTQFAVEPLYVEKPGPDGKVVQHKVRVAQIKNLQRDLSIALAADRLRIQAPVPGQSYVGIEIPNSRTTLVRLRPILESEPFLRLGAPLGVALGLDVSGQPVVADLGRMPHVLIAGTTGSGKSVCIAALATCLVMNNTPEQLRLVLMDPKMVELVRFNGLPHLLGPVETDVERMVGALKWAIGEMEARYKVLEEARTRDLETYNRKMERRNKPGLPRIVIIIDELADLMMLAPEPTEKSLVRLAQMARAVGMHLAVATQRPSTEVVTGLIKANFPARISFNVASAVDSRVILDTVGAESLLGKGDMLFLNPEVGSPQRVQGVMVTDEEVERVVGYWRKASPVEQATQAPPWEGFVGADEKSADELVEQAIEFLKKNRRISTSLLQRRLRIGFPRAARLLDELEARGYVGPYEGAGRDREVLIDGDESDETEEDELDE